MAQPILADNDVLGALFALAMMALAALGSMAQKRSEKRRAEEQTEKLRRERIELQGRGLRRPPAPVATETPLETPSQETPSVFYQLRPQAPPRIPQPEREFQRPPRHMVPATMVRPAADDESEQSFDQHEDQFERHLAEARERAEQRRMAQERMLDEIRSREEAAQQEIARRERQEAQTLSRLRSGRQKGLHVLLPEHINYVTLAKPGHARAAMIYHEIFSSPKALRSEGDFWDM